MIMTPLQKLKAATSRRDVASLLNINLPTLTYILFVREESKRYNTFAILKKGGGKREISAPSGDLKSLQQALAEVIKSCVLEIDIARGFVNTVSHGFMPERSIITNAYVHRNKNFVFNLDLKDFFGTITFQRLRGFFIKDKNFSLHVDVATLIAQIACHQGKLPQGSPCSPIMSNLIGQILDVHMLRLAKLHGCHYSRYADDLTFSTNEPDFPKQIAEQCPKNGAHSWNPGKDLVRLIEKCDFFINPKKTRMQYRDSRQEVTGLITNKKVNIRSEYRREVRAMVYKLFTKGEFTVEKLNVHAVHGVTTEKVKGSLDELHGRLGFIHSIDEFNRKLIKDHQYNHLEKHNARPSGKDTIYLRFLLYKFFYANPMPLIICEGKTDNIFLSNAIHELSAIFPSLVKHDATGKKILNLQFFNHSSKNTAKILGNESGGYAGLIGMMRRYCKELSLFKAPKGSYPVIVVVDNDSACTNKGGIYEFLKKDFGISAVGSEEKFNPFGNIFIVPTPLNGQPTSCIEDFFTHKDKSKIVDGKMFDPTDKLDKKTHYGKAVFAYKIVAAEPKNIDFNLFKPLIFTINKIINDYHP